MSLNDRARDLMRERVEIESSIFKQIDFFIEEPSDENLNQLAHLRDKHKNVIQRQSVERKERREREEEADRVLRERILSAPVISTASMPPVLARTSSARLDAEAEAARLKKLQADVERLSAEATRREEEAERSVARNTFTEKFKKWMNG